MTTAARISRVTRTLAATLLLGPAAAGAQTIWVVGGPFNKTLMSFDSAAPGVATAVVPLIGVSAGEVTMDIDFRPATGELYLLTSDWSVFPNVMSFYRVALPAGTVTLVASAALPQSAGLDPGVAYYSFDFDPVADLARVTNGEDNFHVDPVTGDVVPDTAFSPLNVRSIAYDRNYAGSPATTLFGVTGSQVTPMQLVRLGGVDGNPSPADGGAATLVGPLGLSTSTAEWVGFDVAAGGTAFFSFYSDDIAGQALYTLDLATGTATLVGAMADDILVQRGMAVAPAAAVAEVPVLGWPGAAALAALLAAAAAGLLRRTG